MATEKDASASLHSAGSAPGYQYGTQCPGQMGVSMDLQEPYP